MKRRALLTSAALLAMAIGPAAVQAQSNKPLDVVKVMSFSCPVCFASEAQDQFIEQTVKAAGGRFVRAPLPSVEGDMGAKDRVYYASREFSPQLTDKVRASLYKGAQEMGVPLDNITAVYTWLQQDLDIDVNTLNSLIQRSQQSDAEGALRRAVYLARSAGVDRIPAYLLLRDSQVIAALDPTSVPGGLAGLREAVIQRIKNPTKE